MNRLILQTLARPDVEYLTPDAWRPIESYLEGLPRRLALSEKLQNIEGSVVAAVIDHMKSRYPTFADHHRMAWEKGARDVQLTYRYCVQAMVLDDAPGMVERLLVWLRTMLAGNKMTPGFVRDAYESLREQVYRQLSPDECRMLSPVFQATIETLSDFPEPDFAAV